MLTEFVLDRALEEIGGLRRQGLGVTVAVNLGPADLLDLGLPLEISRLLAGHDLPAAALELEVSKSTGMADPSAQAQGYFVARPMSGETLARGCIRSADRR